MRPLSVKKRVAKGIEFMNREYGKYWLRKLTPEEISLRDGKSCILGQVEGDFFEGMNKLGIGHDEAKELGFDISGNIRTAINEYDLLDRTWKQSIVRLQKLFSIQRD